MGSTPLDVSQSDDKIEAEANARWEQVPGDVFGGPRDEFLANLDRLISDTNAAPRFRGQTQAVKSLRRVRDLAVFN